MKASFLSFETVYRIKGMKGTSLNSPSPFSAFHGIHVGVAQALLSSATGVSIQILLIFIIQIS